MTSPRSPPELRAALGRYRWRPGARSAVKNRPADVVAQPLVVKHELANRLRELVALPPALEPPGALALAFGRGSTCGLDRICGRAEVVRGDVRDGPGLARGVRGMPCCPTQVSGRGHAARAIRHAPSKACNPVPIRKLADYTGVIGPRERRDPRCNRISVTGPPGQ